MYCRHCGKQIEDNAKFCVHCGRELENKNIQEGSNIGWGLLGFLIPIVGLIMCLIWNNEFPHRAKALGIGAAIGAGLAVIFYISIAASSAAYIYQVMQNTGGNVETF